MKIWQIQLLLLSKDPHHVLHIPSAGSRERRQDDKLGYGEWMSPLCVLFSMTAQTDGVWPLVCGVGDPAMTYICADVAERRPHSTGIVLTLPMEKEIGLQAGRHTDRQADRQTDCLCASFGPLIVKNLFPLYSAVTWRERVVPRTGTFVQLADGQKETCKALII